MSDIEKYDIQKLLLIKLNTQTMIDKITAHTLAAHGFKLVDKEGRKFGISGIMDNRIFLYGSRIVLDTAIHFNQIGTDFWVLKRDFSMLTKSITVEGEEIVPIVELAKIESEPFKIEEVLEVTQNSFGNVFWVDYYDNDDDCMRFCYCIDSFQKGYVNDKTHWIVKHQPHLFQKLYSLHFIDLPEGTYKLIED